MINGSHKCEKAGLCIARQFTKRYSIVADVDLDNITSRRTTDGVLQLAIPKKGKRSIHIPVGEEPSVTPSLPESAQPVERLEEVTVEVEK